MPCKNGSPTRKEARAAARLQGIITLAFSNPSKMPCRTYSTQARVHCPGSREIDQFGMTQVIEACRACYATADHYIHESTKAVRLFNGDEYKHSQWVDSMVEELRADRYFRFFDSGDMHTLAFARKIYQVMLFSPHCRFWIPTQQHRFAKFRPILELMNRLPNCVVRYSAKTVRGIPLDTRAPQSVQYLNDSEIPDGAHMCETYREKNQTPSCGDCRACWSKDVSIIAYHGHGAKFAKVHAQAVADNLIPSITIEAKAA